MSIYISIYIMLIKNCSSKIFCEVKLYENYFGAKRVRDKEVEGKRCYGAAGKT